jgi:gluconolactonase
MQIRDADGQTIEGVYRINVDGSVNRVLGREVQRANGVALSPDDKFLFVADNANDRLGGARKLWRFELDSRGDVKPNSGKVLFDWGNGRGPDGIKQDLAGRLFVAGGTNEAKPPHEPDAALKGGVYVFDFDGKLLAFQNVPTDEVTNCAFGGDDLRTLYITGGGVLYKMRTKTPGLVYWPH